MPSERKLKLKTLHKSYQAKVASLSRSNEAYRYFLSYLKNKGDSYVVQMARNEATSFDETWLDRLDLGFDAIDRIIANPRSFIKDNGDVVQVALAKRITSESVIHLASHSQYVRGLDEEGNVVPEKILSITSEENIQTYENRLVMSLIYKIRDFIDRRYTFLSTREENRNSNLLLAHSQVEIDGVRYEVDTRVRASIPSDEDGMKEHNARLIARLDSLRHRAAFYINCPFMKAMKGAKPLHNPINPTNLLLKHPDYKVAFALWRFLDTYTKLGIEIKVREQKMDFEERYLAEVESMIAGNMLTLSSHLIDDAIIPKTYATEKVLTPRVLGTLDDLTFDNGRLLYQTYPEIYKANAYERPAMYAPMAYDPSEVKRSVEAYKKAQEEERVYAHDVEEEQQQYRLLVAEYEEQLLQRQKEYLSMTLQREAMRLSAIEEADRIAREQEVEAISKLWDEQRASYENEMLKDSEKLLLAQAELDKEIEGSFAPHPLTEEEIRQRKLEEARLAKELEVRKLIEEATKAVEAARKATSALKDEKEGSREFSAKLNQAEEPSLPKDFDPSKAKVILNEGGEDEEITFGKKMEGDNA